MIYIYIYVYIKLDLLYAEKPDKSDEKKSFDKLEKSVEWKIFRF